MSIDLQILKDYNAARQCAHKDSLCHAPESTMYFGSNGNVSACCYNRTKSFGQYPAQSVEEIWTSAIAQSMRQALRRNELPDGCELCADQFYARNFKGLLASGFDRNARPAEPSGWLHRTQAMLRGQKAWRYPIRLDFELSNKCNLECEMCSGYFSSSIRANRENQPPLPQLYGSEFVRQLEPFLPHLKNAKFLGGEPFLIDVYYEIWERLMVVNPTCKVSITTNGTVYTAKVKRVLENLNCEIIISLDSVVKSTYEIIRKNAVLERTLANLDAFTEINRRRKMDLSIAVCPIRSNYKEIPGLIEFANARGMRVFLNTVVFPAQFSLKTLTVPEKRAVLALYSAPHPDPTNELEKANWMALRDYCRQIKYWINDGEADRPPTHALCAELLAARKTQDAVTVLLSDLVEPIKGITANEPDSGLTPEETLNIVIDYIGALWEVGRMMQAGGQLDELTFSDRDRDLCLDHLRNNVRPGQANRVYQEMRRFPLEGIRYAGRLTGEGFIDLLNAHIAGQVGSPPASSTEAA